ncbi:hypothetical protein XAC40_940060 [Xanthomonas citri pv. citri]|nr:hypothetical protein XAC40_940060 [Xanthomonas citri pv. citri]
MHVTPRWDMAALPPLAAQESGVGNRE